MYIGFPNRQKNWVLGVQSNHKISKLRPDEQREIWHRKWEISQNFTKKYKPHNYPLSNICESRMYLKMRLKLKSIPRAVSLLCSVKQLLKSFRYSIGLSDDVVLGWQNVDTVTRRSMVDTGLGSCGELGSERRQHGFCWRDIGATYRRNPETAKKPDSLRYRKLTYWYTVTRKQDLLLQYAFSKILTAKCGANKL